MKKLLITAMLGVCLASLSAIGAEESKGSSRFRVGRLKPEPEKAAKKEALAGRIGINLRTRGVFRL
jgi:hypothetical protein